MAKLTRRRSGGEGRAGKDAQAGTPPEGKPLVAPQEEGEIVVPKGLRRRAAAQRTEPPSEPLPEEPPPAEGTGDDQPPAGGAEEPRTEAQKPPAPEAGAVVPDKNAIMRALRAELEHELAATVNVDTLKVGEFSFEELVAQYRQGDPSLQLSDPERKAVIKLWLKSKVPDWEARVAAKTEKKEPAEIPHVEFGAHSVKKESRAEDEPNEDAYFTDKERGIFGVFDGMGGHAAGEVASGTAKQYVQDRLTRMLKSDATLDDTKQEIENALKEASALIARQAEQNKEHKGMGATGSVVKIWQGPAGERKAVIGNVGDSRVYILRAGGLLEHITVDDNVLTGKVSEAEARNIQTQLANFFPHTSTLAKELDQLDLEAKQLWQERHVLDQALGLGEVTPRMHVMDLQVGERIIITSDGVHDNLTDTQIVGSIQKHKDPEVAAKTLAERAHATSRHAEIARAKDDDATAVVVEIGPAKVPTVVREQGLAPEQETRLKEILLLQLTEQFARELRAAHPDMGDALVKSNAEYFANKNIEDAFKDAVEKMKGKNS